MTTLSRLRTLALSIPALAGLLCSGALVGQATQSPAASLTSETPARFEPVTDSFDYIKRDVMIPMRDGVRLHTVIVIPKGAKNAPILLTRTPYSAKGQTSHAASAHLGPILSGYDNPLEVILQAATSAWCRMCEASTIPKATTL
jgi:uncharacterized protein